MYKLDDICCVVVVYNADDKVIFNMNKTLQYVGKIVVVDNGSSNGIIDKITEAFSNEQKVTLIENKENAGIAFALNQGLNYADKNGYKLFLSMDHDSYFEGNGIEILLNAMNQHNIESVGPCWNKKQIFTQEIIEMKKLISSGNMTVTEIAVRAGGFDNDMFIDEVDSDFSYRVRLCGGKCAIVSDVKLVHKLGEVINAQFLFVKKDIIIHSPFRHYYMARNMVYIKNKYKGKKVFEAETPRYKFIRFVLLHFFYPKEIRKECLLARKKGKKDGKRWVKKGSLDN